MESLADKIEKINKRRQSELDDVRRTVEQEKKAALAKLESRFEKMIQDEMRSCDKLFEEQAQNEFLPNLIRKEKELQSRSKYFNGHFGETPNEILPISFLYSRLNNGNENSLAIMIPARRIYEDEEQSFLPERLKAFTYETLLKDKDEHDILGINNIELIQDQIYTTFIVSFNELLKFDNETIISKSAHTELLDDIFKADFIKDRLFQYVKIHFNGTDGYILNNLDLDIEQTKEIEEESIETAAILEDFSSKDFIPLDEVVDLLFGLDKNHPDYKMDHEYVVDFFNISMGSGNFKEEFDNFDVKETANGKMYNREKVQRMSDGDVEKISGKKGKHVDIVKHYVALTPEHAEDSGYFTIFPLGAYDMKSAAAKFNKTEGVIKRNFKLPWEEEKNSGGNYDCFKAIVDGKEVYLCPYEDLVTQFGS